MVSSYAGQLVTKANGSEVENFNGSSSYAVPSPGQNGGWVEWDALAILEGQGEGAGNPPPNALASPDAKAEQSGAVWVPPASETFDFDAAGNRQSSALWDYGWDGRNKLVRARTKNHDASAQGYDITFGYDSEGRRFKKNVITYRNGAIASQDNITFIWDGWDMIYERHQNPSGLTTLERKYVWGEDIGGGTGGDSGAGGAGGLLLIRETRGTQTKDYYPLYDGSGNVIALADGNRTLVAEYAYGPFGELIHAKGPMAQINPIRYATKYYDSETGLYYFGQRYLDPVTGQWLNREPLGESESVNLYAYCHNDPINRVDVLGLKEYRVKAGAVPVLIAESNGNFGIYLQTESLAIRPLASSCVGAHGFCWADDAPYRVGAVGEATAEKFLSGEIGQSSISSWYALATANFDVMSAEQDLEDLRTMGQILPGFGAGMQFAEGNRITGSAYLVRDVLLFATGTKYIQGASSLSGFALRGAALGAGLGGTSGLIDVTSGRLQAAANGENYDGTIQGDTWTVLRGTRNGAVLGAVLGPLAKLGKMKAAKGVTGEVAAAGSRAGPDFIAAADGSVFPVPRGATGPLPTRAPGMQFTGGSGGNGFDPRVTGVRFMDANANQGARAVYMNQSGQTVNPFTGRTVPYSDPTAHFYFNPNP